MSPEPNNFTPIHSEYVYVKNCLAQSLSTFMFKTVKHAIFIPVAFLQFTFCFVWKVVLMRLYFCTFKCIQ